MKKIVFSLILFFHPKSAYAFQDLIRKGYQTCFGCHYSPNGGGAINDYGRLVSIELATWGNETEAKNLWGLTNYTDKATALIDKGLTLRLHGDARYLSYKQKAEGFEVKDSFLMQSEIQAVIDYKNVVGLIHSYGRYYKVEDPEVRNLYAYLNVGKYFRFRAGRFLPAFGTNLDDHTTFVRRETNFSQGKESVNVEAYAFFKYGELFITERLGNEPKLFFDKSGVRGLDDRADERDIDRALIFKASFFPINKVTVGASAYLPRNKRVKDQPLFSAHLQIVPFKDSYVMTEWVRKNKSETDEAPLELIYSRTGYEIFKGMLARYQYQNAAQGHERNSSKHSLGVTFIPRPHFEIQLDGNLSKEKDFDSNGYTIMTHIWL